MKKRILYLCLLVLTSYMGTAQISGPASVPAGTAVTFTAPGNGAHYNWSVAGSPRDVNPMLYVPVSTTVSANMGITPNMPKMVFDGTNWYSFTSSALSGDIVRLAYGSNPTNSAPVLTTLTTKIPIDAGNRSKALDVVYDTTSASWYIFVSHSYKGLVKLTMGPGGLADNSPVLTGIPMQNSAGTAVLFDVADQLVVKKHNGEWLAFISGTSNPGIGEFVRLDLGVSLAALNAGTPLVKNVLGNSAKYFSLYQEGTEWFAFGSRGATTITFWRTEFGSNLKNNAPAVVDLTSSIPNVASPRGVMLARGCGDRLYGYIMSSQSGGGWHVLDFGTSIKNAPTVAGQIKVPTFPMTGDGLSGISPFVYRDTLYAAMTGWSGGNRMFTVRLLPLTGSETHHYNSAYQHTFSTTGTYAMNVFVNQGGFTGPEAYCHTVNVVNSGLLPQPGGFTAAPTPLCRTQQTVSYTLPQVVGAAAYHWQYTGSGAVFTPSTITSTNALTFNGSATGGTLRVWAVDNNGDSSLLSRDTTIVINALPVLSINPAIVTICAGQSATLTAGGATTFSWSPSGGNAAAATVSPATTTMYTVTGTSLGCSSTMTRQVEVTPLPNVTINPATVSICAGESATLTASGATSYTWAPAGGTNSSATVSPLSTTTYSVTGLHQGCSATVTRVVVVNSLPVTQVSVSGGVREVCTGDTAHLTASGSYDFEWKNGNGLVVGANQSYGVYATGNYKVIATDPGSGCKDSTQPVDIRVYSRPVVSLNQVDTSFCRGSVLKLEVSTSDTSLTYVWKENGVVSATATASFLEVSETGSFQVIVGRASVASCEDSTNEVQVTVHDLPVVDITWDGEKLHATPGYASYQWRSGSQDLLGAKDSTLIPTSNGGYSVTVTDDNGCENTSVVQNLKNVGVDEMSAYKVSVYPNPSSGLVYIESDKLVNVLVYSADGRLLSHVPDARYVDIGRYASGVYLLRIIDVEGRLIRNERIIKNSF